MDTLQVLVKARAEVEKGWCQFALEDRHGNCCVIGAVQRAEAAMGFDRDMDVRHALRDALPAGHDRPYRFNNDPATTKDDVLALLDRAAAQVVAASPDPAHTFATVA